jgi:hypothetical protein
MSQPAPPLRRGKGRRRGKGEGEHGDCIFLFFPLALLGLLVLCRWGAEHLGLLLPTAVAAEGGAGEEVLLRSGDVAALELHLLHQRLYPPIHVRSRGRRLNHCNCSNQSIILVGLRNASAAPLRRWNKLKLFPMVDCYASRNGRERNPIIW